MGRISDIVSNCDGLISRHAKGAQSFEDRVGIAPHRVRLLMQEHNKDNYVVSAPAFTSVRPVFIQERKYVKADNLLKPTFTCKTKRKLKKDSIVPFLDSLSIGAIRLILYSKRDSVSAIGKKLNKYFKTRRCTIEGLEKYAVIERIS